MQVKFWPWMCVLLAGAELTAQPQAQRPAGREPGAVVIVIGNQNYANLPKPHHPIADATDVAALLDEMLLVAPGRLVLLTDATRAQMEERLSGLAGELQSGDAVFLYYSGYGVSHQGRNYLLPVDVPDGAAAGDLARVAINPVDVLQRTASVPGPRVVVLDASRPVTLPGVARAGLAPLRPDRALILSSTEAGGTIEDDPAQRNSLFTRHLLAEMKALWPESAWNAMAAAVRDGVAKESAGRQTPAIYQARPPRTILLPMRPRTPASLPGRWSHSLTQRSSINVNSADRKLLEQLKVCGLNDAAIVSLAAKNKAAPSFKDDSAFRKYLAQFRAPNGNACKQLNFRLKPEN